MKILVVGPHMTKARGGMSSVIRDIQESEELNREFDIDIYPSYIDGNLALRLWYSVYAYFRFLPWCGKYDLLHIHTAEKGSTFRKNLYLRAAKRAGKKAIVHIHGAEYLTFYDGLGERGKKAVRKFFQQADLTLALSESWRRELESRFPMKECRTLYNGVDAGGLEAAKGDPAAHCRSFLMLGRMGKRKGVYDLIAAVELAVKRDPELQICLAGDGEVEKVRAVVAEKGLERNVSVLGWISGEERLARMRAAGTIVLPSYYEGLPMAVLEGMAAGKAVISTAVGAIPEVVGEDNGILVEPGDVQALADAMLRCSGSPEFVERLSQANMEKARRFFDIRQIHRLLAEYYRRAAEEGSNGGK